MLAGCVLKKPVITNTPNGSPSDTYARTNPTLLLSRSSVRIWKNSGMITCCNGSISPARKKKKIGRDPGNVNRDNAYADIADSSMTSDTVQPVTMTLLTK